MKKTNFLMALVICTVLALSALADGETHSGGRTDPPPCPPNEACSVSQPVTTNPAQTKPTNPLIVVFETILSAITGK